MGMAVKVRMLLAARQMTLKDLGEHMTPPYLCTKYRTQN